MVATGKGKGKLGRGRARRGYPVALLLGFEERRVACWEVFSESTRHLGMLGLGGRRRDVKRVYHLHEGVVDLVRPRVRAGLKTLVLLAPPGTGYHGEFVDHLRTHHRWLVGRGPHAVSIGFLDGLVRDPESVEAVVSSEVFREVLGEATGREGDALVQKLEKLVATPERDWGEGAVLLYTLQEIENVVYRLPRGGGSSNGAPRPEYLLLTDQFLEAHRMGGRMNRLLQVARNRGVKTRVIDAESCAGSRVAQFGGIVAFR
ncbi:MAG: hypothetical protein ACTSU5_13435 [Promethearchaeota archaeon]